MKQQLTVQYTVANFRAMMKEALDSVDEGDLVLIKRGDDKRYAVVEFDEVLPSDNHRPMDVSDIPPDSDEDMPPPDVAQERVDKDETDIADPWLEEMNEPKKEVIKEEGYAPYGHHRCGCIKLRLRHLCKKHGTL